jgi:hypothetical protein
VSETAFPRQSGYPRCRGTPWKAAAAVSSAATGGTRERAAQPSERRAGERIGAAYATRLRTGVPRLLSYHIE